jgi:glycosyltransferase involved in cell wall biosynthesis
MKILHTLAKSYPSINGYTVRSHEILMAQNAIKDVEAVALTSPYYEGIYRDDDDETINGTRYIRTGIRNLDSEGRRIYNKKIETKLGRWVKKFSSPLLFPLNLLQKYNTERIQIKVFQEKIEQVSNRIKPDIIHAHTPYKVGLPSLKVSKLYNLPFVYEVRGIWEESAVSRGVYRKFGLKYLRFRWMENKVMNGADRIFCLTEEIKSNLIRRGIREEKIKVMPNAAPSRFLNEDLEATNERVNLDLTRIINFKSKSKMVGYIGNIESYEGIGLVIKSLERLQTDGLQIKFLVISNNENYSPLERICKESKIKDNIMIIGPIEHSNLRGYYSLLDAIVVPRLGESAMAQMVTPLKQMEALALGIPLLISNIPAIIRIIGEDTATIFESGNINDLSHKIKQVISGGQDILSRVDRGRDWIKHHANWDNIASIGLREYKQISR